MANPLGKVVGRAPKWAWYAAGGIGLGGAAIQLYRQRNAKTAKLAGDTTTNPDGTPADSGAVGLNPSPQPSIVVPPVIIPQNSADPLAGILPLQDLYLSTIGQVVSGWQDIAAGWQNVYQPVIGHDENLIDQLAGMVPNAQQIADIANAGPAPQAYTAPPAEIAPPPAAQAPAPAPCGGQFPLWNPTRGCYRVAPTYRRDDGCIFDVHEYAPGGRANMVFMNKRGC